MKEDTIIGISVDAVQLLIKFASRALLTRAEWRSLENIEIDLTKFLEEVKTGKAESTTKAEDTTPKE